MADAIKKATDTLRAAMKDLEGEETRLAAELATVKTKRRALEKAVKTMEDTTVSRPRGRPRSTAGAAA